VKISMMPCPVCGSPANPPDWTAAAECYGHAWQTCFISCSAPHCSHGVSIEIDGGYVEGGVVEAAATAAWEAVAVGRRK
jgi:hypothetical protein